MSQIKEILDLTRSIRKDGGTFNPLFVGPPGVGKSQEIQQWAKTNGLPFIDIRAAYLEAPDLIGFPSIENKNGRQITVHNTPEFLPHVSTAPEGILLLEEPNRGTSSIMNTFMQLLTDRKVHNYTLPDGWIIVAAINPETAEYEVNTMDPALKNRFVMFQVDYNKKEFVSYMKASNWEKVVIDFVESNTWQFAKPEQVAKTPGSKYVSPRTLEQLNEVCKHDLSSNLELVAYDSILGGNLGRAFYEFRYNDAPVSFHSLEDKRSRKKALEKLKAYCDPNNYRNGHISITVKDILEHGTIENDLLVQVVMVMPADQAAALVRDLEYKRDAKAGSIMEALYNESPELKKLHKAVLK